MNLVVLAFVLLAGIVALTPVAERLGIPQPVVLTLFGLALGSLPFTPELSSLDPHAILPVVLPPLLFAATQRTTVQEFRSHARAVVLLAVGLTIATIVVVSLVAHSAGLPWPAAWLLGAIISPPDPVAATAVARRLRLPHRLVTILEGEGMFNDATALVAYKVAVAAAVTGTLTWSGPIVKLVLAIVVGVGCGLALGWLTRAALAALHQGYVETTVTVLAPFAAYLGAEQLWGSGVLAVLALGLYLRTYSHRATTSQGWLVGRSVWSFADFLITSLVFAVLGFELVKIIGHRNAMSDSLGLAAAVVGAVVVFRALWVFPFAWLSRERSRRRDYPSPVGWRESAVVSWAGMRGVVTVATALALPYRDSAGHPFPHRDAVVFAALSCVLLTLVVQGLTLGPLVRLLRVASEEGGQEELIELRRRAAEAALRSIQETAAAGTPEEVRQAAALQWEGYLDAQDALTQARALELQEGDASARLQQLLDDAVDAERDLVLDARRTGQVTSATADEVLREIETRALRDFR